MIEYKIYQLKKERIDEYGFLNMAMLKHLGKYPVLSNYDVVYQGVIARRKENVLEQLFRIFNMHKPSDYLGRSMSVSDIVEVDGQMYYCDSGTWSPIFNKKKPRGIYRYEWWGEKGSTLSVQHGFVRATNLKEAEKEVINKNNGGQAEIKLTMSEKQFNDLNSLGFNTTFSKES